MRIGLNYQFGGDVLPANGSFVITKAPNGHVSATEDDEVIGTHDNTSTA